MRQLSILACPGKLCANRMRMKWQVTHVMATPRMSCAQQPRHKQGLIATHTFTTRNLCHRPTMITFVHVPALEGLPHEHHPSNHQPPSHHADLYQVPESARSSLPSAPSTHLPPSQDDDPYQLACIGRDAPAPARPPASTCPARPHRPRTYRRPRAPLIMMTCIDVPAPPPHASRPPMPRPPLPSPHITAAHCHSHPTTLSP